MKNKLFFLFVAIGMEFVVFQSKAQQAPLTFGIDRTTGHLIATDVWNNRAYDKMVKDAGDPGKMVNGTGPWKRNLGFFILANTFELETNGTGLNASMIIGFRTLPGYTNPNDFIHTFWVETSDEVESLGNVYYGHDMTGKHDDNITSISRLKVDPLSHQKIKDGEVLWILKVSYSVELQKPIAFIPNILISFSIGGVGMQYYEYHATDSQHKTTLSEVKRQLQKDFITATNLAKINKPNTPTASVLQLSGGTTSSTLPEINISITKQDGFLLITFSPAVANASLEQANLNSYPWAWQPAITVTNSATNGWYVDPNLKSRVFRIRIDR